MNTPAPVCKPGILAMTSPAQLTLFGLPPDPAAPRFVK